MHCVELTTAGIPAHRQLDSWQSWYGSVFHVNPLGSPAAGFVAHQRSWSIPGLSLTWVSAQAQAVVRTKAQIRREPIDHWAITLASRNETRLASPKGELRAPASIPFVLSLGHEMSSERDADDRIQLYLSRDCFFSLSAALDACCMTTLDVQGGRLLADYMSLMIRNLPDLSDEDSVRLTDATRSMLAACLAPSVRTTGEASAVINVTMMNRVRQVILRNLTSRELGVELVCREASASRSQIYRLLHKEGGIARYIQKLRLLESLSMLRDKSCRDTIEVIAEKLLFSDGSTFARAFRREFGLTPSDARAAAEAGYLPIGQSAAAPPIAITFADSLRSLR